jgi:hypothetical protein
MAITNEQWKDVELELSYSFGRVEMLIDGYNVILRVENYGKLKLKIMTYVNGVFEGKWVEGKAEEAKRFLFPKSSYLHSTKERSDLTKIYGGKRCPKAQLEKINRKIVFYSPNWGSVKTIRRHFEKHNKSLEIVKIGF